jgi:hypothetical protein
MTHPLASFGLNRTGIVLPKHLRKRLRHDQKKVQREARSLRHKEQADRTSADAERNTQLLEPAASHDNIVAESEGNPSPKSFHCAQCYATAIIQWRRTCGGS